MFDFTNQGRPIEPVKRPGSVAILDRLRTALSDAWANYSPPPVFWLVNALDAHTGSLDSLGEKIEEIAPFVSPLPIHFAIDELAEITTAIQQALATGRNRGEVNHQLWHEVARLISLRAKLIGPGPEDLRDDLAVTAVAVAAGQVA